MLLLDEVIPHSSLPLPPPPPVSLQKLGMFHLDEVDFVGGPAHGLTAIVTGSTSGIGVETAAALARRGARGGEEAMGAVGGVPVIGRGAEVGGQRWEWSREEEQGGGGKHSP